MDTSSSAATSTADLPSANICAARCRTCSRRARSAWSTPPPSPYRMRSAEPTPTYRDDHPQASQWICARPLTRKVSRELSRPGPGGCGGIDLFGEVAVDHTGAVSDTPFGRPCPSRTPNATEPLEGIRSTAARLRTDLRRVRSGVAVVVLAVFVEPDLASALRAVNAFAARDLVPADRQSSLRLNNRT